MTGLWDRHVGVDVARDLADRLPHGLVRLFERSAHPIDEKEPGQYVAAITDFLRASSARTGTDGLPGGRDPTYQEVWELRRNFVDRSRSIDLFRSTNFCFTTSPRKRTPMTTPGVDARERLRSSTTATSPSYADCSGMFASTASPPG
jgi:hypothetical protein